MPAEMHLQQVLDILRLAAISHEAGTLMESLNLQGKLVAAVCHGPAALTEAKLNGEYLVKGKKVEKNAMHLLAHAWTCRCHHMLPIPKRLACCKVMP